MIDFSRAVLYGIFHQEETPERTKPVKNTFVQQFSENIKFKYSCFDRVILRGYILWLFFPAGVVKLLYAMGFRKLSNGVMRILTDQLNAHIQKVAQAKKNPFTGDLPPEAARMGQNKSSSKKNTPSRTPARATAYIAS